MTKIIQLILMPQDQRWQGRLLGLGDNGVTYELSDKGKWERFIDALDLKEAFSDTRPNT